MIKIKGQELLPIAHKWYKRGVITFPLYFMTKTPTVKWGGWAENRPSWQDISETFDTELYRNLAIMCGSMSGGLVVIDFDIPLPYYQWATTYPVFSETYTVKTRRGFHVYLYVDNPPPRTQKFDGGDIKVTGYVAAPPSVHKSGAQYRALNESAVICKVESLDVVGIEALEFEPLPEGDDFDFGKSTSGQIIQHIQHAIPIALYLSRYTDLKPTSNDGRWLRGCCVFHHDTDPSMWVDTVNQRCGCLSTNCLIYGQNQDVINVHAHINGLDNVEAIRQLAEMTRL